MSEHDEHDGAADGKIHFVALSMDGDDLLQFVAQVHHFAYVRGCNNGFLETLQALSEKIKGLEEELAGKSKNDPYVMGEISALAQFAATVKAGADAANIASAAQLETLGAWCRENNLSPLLAVFSQAVHKHKVSPP
jgi:hypothetical protein